MASIVTIVAQLPPPATPKSPVTNEYHGIRVVDDYQWLENAADPAVREWTAAHNRRTRAWLDELPERPLIQRRLEQLLANPSARYFSLQWSGGRLFALKFQPPAQQPVLVTLASPNETNSGRVVLDLNQFDPKGGTSVDFYAPSPDGRLVAVCLSENGSEQGALHFFEAATGRKLPDVLPRAQFPTGGGSVAWNAAGDGVFYTRYPSPGERPEADLAFYQQVYFHKLGSGVAQDVYEIGRAFPRIAEIELLASPDGRHLLATVANGDGGEFAHYLRGPDGQWRQITQFADQVKEAHFGRDPIYIELGGDRALYLLSFKQSSRGKIVRLPLDEPDLSKAATVIPEGPLAIQHFLPSASGLYVNYLDGGPSSLVFVDFWTKKPVNVPMRGALPGQPEPAASPTAVGQMLVLRGDELLFHSQTYLAPPAWHWHDPIQTRGRAQVTALREHSPVDFSDAEVARVMVKSKDGTRVPLNIIRKKGTRLNGANPTILTGYGGYGISQTPSFDAARRLWLDQGGVMAVANLRGGGEYGEDWHKGGNLLKKQNVFDDFLACAEWLVRSNITRPDKLAIRGGSNGGLLMGAALTQRPDLFGAVVSQVGIYDMLRVERDPNGAFNVTEFGTVKDAAQFKVLYGYSPFHHVQDGVKYPPTLLTTGENDGRVNPAHSRKMTARLQAAGGPVWLRTSGSGHGIGTAFSERIAELSDLYAFLVRQLGIEYTQIERGPWSGAVTTTSVWVKAKLVREGLTARLVASKQPDFSQPLYSWFDRSSAAQHNLVGFRLDQLEPDTTYYYALEIEGRLDRGRAGRFRTFPAGPASFTIAWATCAKTGSTSDVFDRIREHQPLLYINMGDFHYLDIGENSIPRYRAAYDRVLASPQQADLYRNIPFAYIYDDHDFGGNNCNKTTPSRPAARGVYQEYVPYYPLGAGGGDVPIHQSFDIGRVKFLLTDMRSERDPAGQKDDANKSMLGREQKAWLKRELLAANGKYPLIVWMGTVAWVGDKGTNYYPLPSTNVTGLLRHEPLIAAYQAELAKGKKPKPPPDEEHWCAYTTERREIADFIKTNRIQGVCYLHGDMHALAADDGTHGDYATGGGAPIPSMGAAPLDQAPSIKGGPYSQGVYRVKPPEGCFGLLHVTDRGDTIEVAFSGRNNQDEEKITLKFAVPAPSPHAQGGQP